MARCTMMGCFLVESLSVYFMSKRCGRLKSSCTVEHCHLRPMASRTCKPGTQQIRGLRHVMKRHRHLSGHPHPLHLIIMLMPSLTAVSSIWLGTVNNAMAILSRRDAVTLTSILGP
jgi:hypothetical protein